MSEEQSVADNTAPNETVESAQDLDSLLNEFDSQEQAKPEPEQPKDDNSDVFEYVRQQRDEQVKQQTNQDIQNAVGTMNKELEGLNLPERVVRGMLFDKAENDSRFLQAWTNRHQNPAAFDKILKGLATEIRGDFESLPDKQTNEDREALAAAVRSANNKPAEPEQVDFNAMSDAEFAAHKAKLARGG
jgi:hypothetical protein